MAALALKSPSGRFSARLIAKATNGPIVSEARFSPVAGRYRPEKCATNNRLKGNGHRRGYQPQGRRVRAKKTVSERSPLPPAPPLLSERARRGEAEGLARRGSPVGIGKRSFIGPLRRWNRRSAAASCPAPRSAGTAFPRHRSLRRTAFYCTCGFRHNNT